MRISLHALGTRGDVQPFVALACALRARGHMIQIAAPTQFKALIAEKGLAHAALPGGLLDLLDSPAGRAAVAEGRGFSAGFKLLKHVGPLMAELLEAEWTVARTFKPDVIVGHPKSIAAPHIASAMGTAYVLASPIPGFTPTMAYPSPMLDVRSLGPLNRLSHLLMTHSAGALFAKPIRRWRRQTLGLRAGQAPAKPVATLYAHSQHLLPRPADFPPEVHVTGFWFMDSPEYTPPVALLEFLAAGDAPVSVGFGSLPGFDPAALTKAVVDGLALAGKRGVLIGAGGALVASGLPATCFYIDQVPYDWLFRQVTATLHHGGAGTTASSLRAGKPNVACPVMADQPFWARCIETAGFGPPALDRRSLTPSTIASAIRETDRPEFRSRCSAAAMAIAAEGGVEAAAKIVGSLGA